MHITSTPPSHGWPRPDLSLGGGAVRVVCPCSGISGPSRADAFTANGTTPHLCTDTPSAEGCKTLHTGRHRYLLLIFLCTYFYASVLYGGIGSAVFAQCKSKRLVMRHLFAYIHVILKVLTAARIALHSRSVVTPACDNCCKLVVPVLEATTETYAAMTAAWLVDGEAYSDSIRWLVFRQM
jgi:hypothetical protein